MLIRDCFALQPQEKKLVVHFLFDGFRLALLRPRIGGGEQGWTRFASCACSCLALSLFSRSTTSATECSALVATVVSRRRHQASSSVRLCSAGAQMVSQCNSGAVLAEAFYEN